MKAVVQRVSQAQVEFKNQKQAIKKGFVVLVAATHQDTSQDVKYLAQKLTNLRIMSDEYGKMNQTLAEHNGEILLISQFTLFARTRKGNRPSFIDAADPEKARLLYQELISKLRNSGLKVKTGEFGEYMKVKLINDGPVTIIIDTVDRLNPRKST